MYFIWYIIIGSIAGVVADKHTRGYGLGRFANVLVGIVGGLLGGWAFGFLGMNLPGSLLSSLLGAILLLWLLSFIKDPYQTK